jgi:IS30 family transposase
MTFKQRFKLTEQQRNDMWRRWKAGQSLHEVGRAFGKAHGVIHFMLAQHGGIAPAVRRRSPLTLTLAEREEISRGIASGGSIREIAKGLKRTVSTVSREVARHGGRPLYRATDADQQAWNSALRPKRCLLALHVKLQEVVEAAPEKTRIGLVLADAEFEKKCSTTIIRTSTAQSCTIRESLTGLALRLVEYPWNSSPLIGELTANAGPGRPSHKNLAKSLNFM